jgi:hypothetical protein
LLAFHAAFVKASAPGANAQPVAAAIAFNICRRFIVGIANGFLIATSSQNFLLSLRFEIISSRAKAHHFSVAHAARLKSCPDTFCSTL